MSESGSAETPLAHRVLAGFGVTMALMIATTVITFGGVALHGALDHHHGPGLGQGEGLVCMLVVLITPLFGLVAAWKWRVGAALGVLLMLALTALHLAFLADL